MKQLVILSGKGGTGKTSVTASFAHLTHLHPDRRAVFADADVDAANLELVLAPIEVEREPFVGGRLAVIDPVRCIDCGACEDVCRFDAIHPGEGSRQVDPIQCEGCAACVHVCPENAIHMEDQVAGSWTRSDSRYGPLLHANLEPAQENSGKLVTLIKQHARLLALDSSADLLLVDGPPGIGCPVISAVSGADFALVVAEPTASGVHDMERVLETTAHFEVPSAVCINKADIYPDGCREIEETCRINNLPLLGKIPYDVEVTHAMVQGEPVTAYAPESAAGLAIGTVYERVMAWIGLGGSPDE